MQPETPKRTVLYTAKTHTTGARERGVCRSSDGQLDVVFSMPGSTSFGTNPEQLLAAGWSVCFRTALDRAAEARAIALPSGIAIDAEIDLCRVDNEHVLSARLSVSMPGIARDTALSLVQEAHERCPYSKATRGNVEVSINLAGDPAPTRHGGLP